MFLSFHVFDMFLFNKVSSWFSMFQSFIACALGIENIGYVMICYGVTDAICSLSFGRLVQFVGHMPFFALGRIIFLYSCFRLF